MSAKSSPPASLPPASPRSLRDRYPVPPSSELTPKAVYEGRRELIRMGSGLGAGSLLARGMGLSGLAFQAGDAFAQAGAAPPQKLVAQPSRIAPIIERPTAYKDVTTYNNFYEFGSDKSDPARHAQGLRTRPWTISVEGAVAKPRVFDIEDLLKLAPLEERIYRLRCIEGWSMVIPWVGYSLSELIRRVQPTGNAKFVEFISLADATQMPGMKSATLNWPYTEALRLDEASHPLTLLTLGLYGEVLPKQNGAPVRLVVPWKYGFKGAKSIVKIRFVEKQPVTSWAKVQPEEYGFYANVNPEVDHPRWPQDRERRIGEDGLFQRKRKTLMFNGYAEQVASMYAGMNLETNF